MKNFQRLIRGVAFASLIILGALSIISTGGGGTGTQHSSSDVLDGIFLDSGAVEGLSYTTDSQSGITDIKGRFRYKPGETIRFFIGGIEFGITTAKSRLTLVSLVPGAIDETDPIVLMMSRFLQTLDFDNDPDNGITITASMRHLASGQIVDFLNDDEATVQDMVNFLNGTPKILVSEDIAMTLLKNTLIDLFVEGTWEIYIQGDVNGTGSFSLYIDKTCSLNLEKTWSGALELNKIDNFLKLVICKWSQGEWDIDPNWHFEGTTHGCAKTDFCIPDTSFLLNISGIINENGSASGTLTIFFIDPCWIECGVTTFNGVWYGSYSGLPIADDLEITTEEETPVSFTTTAFDPDDDLLTWHIDTPPAHGTLSGTAPNLTYTPDPNYSGEDSFTFYVNDGSSNSNTATVSITITSANDPPVAQDQSVTTSENTPVSITLNATDPDSAIANWYIDTPPAHG
ncbi:MAG: cadherin-like domain-containing protein, partial [Deltaproteobacteria bacterium]|nr:cadherin-like domain-containing protein [Deltaproteobacteria bacterium]